MIISSAFRTPTFLKSIDLQFGQCAENMDLVGFLRCAVRSSRTAVPIDRHAVRRTAGFTGGLDLLRRSDIRL